jgi:hypothetical protein
VDVFVAQLAGVEAEPIARSAGRTVGWKNSNGCWPTR